MKKALGLICAIAMCLFNYERVYAMDEDMEYLKEMLEERMENSEARQYEMNIVLEELFIKAWKRMPYALDEIETMKEFGEEPDAPLGEYTPDKLKEYTDEDIQVEFEYCYGYSSGKSQKEGFTQLIQIVQIYEKGELYATSYYCWMKYGTVSGCKHYYLDEDKVKERRKASGNYWE